jgi:glutamate dehydrogenase
VLLGWTKLYAKRMLAASELVEHPSLWPVRDAYFPELLRERFGEAIESHPLRREITATALTNRVIDHAGVTLVPALSQATGAGAAEVIAAWYVVDRVLEAEHLRWAVAEQKLPEATRLRAALWIEDALRDAARARLGLERRVLLEPEEIANWIGLVRSLREILHECLDATTRERATRAADAFVAQGIEPVVAFELGRLPALVRLLGIVPVALRSGASLPRAAAVHAQVGRRCGIAWLLERLAGAPARDGWDRVAAESLWLDCVEVDRRLCERMLAGKGVGAQDVDAFCAAHAAPLRRVEQTILDIESDDRGGVAALAVLAAQIRRLL